MPMSGETMHFRRAIMNRPDTTRGSISIIFARPANQRRSMVSFNHPSSCTVGLALRTEKYAGVSYEPLILSFSTVTAEGSSRTPLIDYQRDYEFANLPRDPRFRLFREIRVQQNVILFDEIRRGKISYFIR